MPQLFKGKKRFFLLNNILQKCLEGHSEQIVKISMETQKNLNLVPIKIILGYLSSDHLKLFS